MTCFKFSILASVYLIFYAPNMGKITSSFIIPNSKAFLIPSYDNNIDTNQTASVNLTVDMTTPWREFAASPFGTLWGDWRTRTDVARTTIISGTQNSLVYDSRGNLVSSTPILGPSSSTTSWSTGDTTTVQSSVAATTSQSLIEAQRVSASLGINNGTAVSGRMRSGPRGQLILG